MKTLFGIKNHHADTTFQVEINEVASTQQERRVYLTVSHSGVTTAHSLGNPEDAIRWLAVAAASIARETGVGL